MSLVQPGQPSTFSGLSDALIDRSYEIRSTRESLLHDIDTRLGCLNSELNALREAQVVVAEEHDVAADQQSAG